MKYCSYCGASLLGGAISFCAECGKAILRPDDSVSEEISAIHQTETKTNVAQPPTQSSSAVSQRQHPVTPKRPPDQKRPGNTHSKLKASPHQAIEPPAKKRPPSSKRKKKKPENALVPKVNPQDIGYDGYYDDIQPEDNGYTHERLDPELFKRIAAIIAGALIVAILSVAIMYLL